MDFIRITALTDIGNNIAYSSLVPVVDMAGTPTTKKANLQIVGNLILNGAGGTYFAPAARSVLAQTVTNAAQPNITSVGTLSNLAVSGNVNLGLIGNINIGGGNPGQLLATNGNGGLSWVNDPSGVYSNSNVANYLPTFTGTVGANTIRSTANSGSNVQIDANGAVFMFGQGGALQWPAPGGAQWVIEPNIDDEFEIKSTSNVVISTDISNANSHFTFDSDGIFTAPSNVNLLGSRLNVGPDAANAANLLNPTLVIANSGSQYIQAAIINNNPNGSADLSADGAGGGDEEAWTDMGFAGYTFNDANYTITEPGDGYLFVQGYANGLGGNMVLATGDHSNTADIIFATGGFLANAEFARIDHANDVFHLTRTGAGIKYPDGSIQTTAAGSGGLPLANGNSNFNIANANGNATVTTAGTQTWIFGTDGNLTIPNDIISNTTIEIDNRASGNSADINIYSADDILLQARDRATGSTSEGGDINIFAGDSAEDSDTSGGDVIIEAGNGGASNIDFGGSGGFIRIEAGDGGAASANYEALSGGSLTLTAGDAGTNNGNIFRGSSGGDVTINAGDSTGNGDSGGEIILNTGLAGANALAGRVQINIPSSANGNGGTWTFDGTGNLTLPDNTWSVNYANGTQVPLGGGGNTGNVTFDDVTVQGVNQLNLSAGADFTANLAYLQVRAGDVASHIHLDTGNNEAYDLIVGDDAKFVQVSSTGDIIMSSYDGNTSYTWTLDTTGNLILAGFLGGEESSFEIGYHNGNAPNAFIHSGGNTWTFDNGGNLTFPRDAAGNTDPILTIAGGATPRILSADVSLAGPANLEITALNTIFTGSSGSAIKIYADDGEIGSTANLQIWTNSGGNTEYSWTFDTDGNLTLPGNISLSTANGIIDSTSNLEIYSGTDGNNGAYLALGSGSGNIGGDISIISGEGTVTTGGNIILQGGIGNTKGGNATLQGGSGLGAGGNGGDVEIVGGFANVGGLSGNITLYSGVNQWKFDNNGNLTLPGDLVAISASPAPVIRGFSSVSALQFTNGNSNVTVNANSNLWTFDSTGNLIIPGSSGGFIKTVANASIGVAAVDNGTNNPAQLLSMTNAGAATSIVSAYATNATIQTNATGTINTWAFDSTGNLTLPGNAVAIKFANGSAAFGNIATINLNGNTSQVLLGNGAFAAIPSSSIIANGNSNVSIASSNGNVVINAVGGARITATATGANVAGTLTSTGKIGYASGSTVTQTTNRGTSVTIDALAGTIVTVSASMVAGFIDTFGVSNNQVDPNNDIVLVQIVSPNFGMYNVIAQPSAIINGFNNGFFVNIQNISGGPSSTEAITIRFMVIKAPNA